MSARTPAVSVVIPARDAEATLGRALDALAAQELPGGFETVVVDDGSSDHTAEIARDHPLRPTVISNSRPAGAGTARNRGAAATSAPAIAFTDADCVPAPDWLRRGLEALADNDLVQGTVLPDPEAERGPFDRTVIVTGEQGYYQTANLIVRRELFERIGGFEDWIVVGGDGPFGWRAPRAGPGSAQPLRGPIGEDVLFGWTARRRGARTGFSPDALVHHAVFPMSPIEAIRYRWTWRFLPALARRIPEMRDQTFYRRWFFERRSALFDLALAGVLAALLSRRPSPLLAAVPYARWVWSETVTWRGHGALKVAGTTVAVDAASFAALLTGSAAWRSVLL
jgi:glycosyltransferase involved in cell wall biosynthesis